MDVSGLLTSSGLSFEICSHPDSWVNADNLEHFLRQLCEQNDSADEMTLVESVGLQASELRAWGVLDSVLKMIRSPKDIFQQPQRFLSYFIYPAPPIKKVSSELESIKFEVPFFFEEYPYTFTYLKSCFASVTQFIGATPVQVSWENNVISIDWSTEQKDLLQEANYNLNPELIQSIIDTIEANNAEIRDLQAQLANKTMENEKLLEMQDKDVQSMCWTTHDKKAFEDQIMKLQDYFFRAQQLVTILAGADNKSKFVREAMRKVHWNNVPQLFPETVNQLKAKLSSNQPMKNELGDPKDSVFQLELQ